MFVIKSGRSHPHPPHPATLRCGGEGGEEKAQGIGGGRYRVCLGADGHKVLLAVVPRACVRFDGPVLSPRLAARLCERRRERGVA